MQKIASHIIIGILLLTAPIKILSQTVTPPAIVITEIGEFEPSETEWLEILNTTTSGIDVTGWKFYEDGTNHSLSAAKGDFIIEPNEYAVIANKADPLTQKYPQYAGTILDSSWSSLNENGEEIGIKDSSGNFIELFTYPAKSETGSSTSIERVDIAAPPTLTENWVRNQTNSIGAATPLAAIVVAEQPQPPTAETATPDTSISGTSTTTGTTTPSETSTAEIQNPNPPVEEPPATQPQAEIPNTESAPLAEETPTAPPPQNQPPNAVIQVQSGALTAAGETTINFDGRASSDPEGDSLTYIWDMGDSTSASSANPGPHKYNKPGTYMVTLTVLDSHGNQSVAQQLVQVLTKQANASGIQIPAPQTAPQTTPAIIAPTALTAPAKETPQKTPAQTAPATSAKKTTSKKAAVAQPSGANLSDLINSTLTLNGFFVFVPTESAEFATTKKKTSATKTPAKTTTKTIVPKTKTGTTQKKTSSLDGDLSTEIKISEVFPAPENGEDEWMELFNNGDQDISLGNWAIEKANVASAHYALPDSEIIPANGFLLLPKSKTRLSLNNKGDTLLLKDFEGNTIDTLTYEKAKPSQSYALIKIVQEKETATTVAISGNSYLAKAASTSPKSKVVEEKWDWVATPTPGSANPIFEKIDGSVSRLIAGGDSLDGKFLFDVTMPDGEIKTINFSDKELDPMTAKTALSDGTSISVEAQIAEDGSYKLNKIDEVRPSAKPEEEGSNYQWILFIVIAVSVVLNTVLFVNSMRKKGE